MPNSSAMKWPARFYPPSPPISKTPPKRKPAMSDNFQFIGRIAVYDNHNSKKFAPGLSRGRPRGDCGESHERCSDYSDE